MVDECTDSWGNKLAAKVLVPKQQPYEAVRSNWSHEFKVLVTFYLITERCHSTLSNLFQIPNYNGLTWIMPAARCLLQSGHFLHRADVVHKDIYPGNIFTSIIKDEILPGQYNAIRFKLGDCGISMVVNEIAMFNTIVAEWMLPPEF